MRIAFLAGQNSIHTVRWVNAMAEKMEEVHLLTMHNREDIIHGKVEIHQLPFKAPHGYFLNKSALKTKLKDLKPDLLHVHYASGYGTLGRLSRFHPLLLSVWGSDVYDFPAQNLFNRAIVASNLRSADWVCSTSEVMAVQTKSICPNLKNLTVTPFGIDVEKFKLIPGLKDNNFITVGTVKKLTPKYGIDILIKAFALVKSSLTKTTPEIAAKLRLTIVGDGPDRNELKSLANRLELHNSVNFVGAVPHDKVPDYLNQMDIYVAVSRLDSESFGVAILEASACSIPVVVSNVGGLPEVVQDGVTGYVVPKENHNATAEAIAKLLKDASLRQKMGFAGRQLVLDKYKWSGNVMLMQQVYYQILENKT